MHEDIASKEIYKKDMYKIEERRNDNKDNLPYAYWLYNVPGIGTMVMKKLLQSFETTEEIYRADEKALRPLLAESTLHALEESKKYWNIEKEYETLMQKGVSFYPFTHPGYPKRLRSLSDAPAALYCIGRLPPEDAPSAAMIGARNCSAYGASVAEEIAEILAEAGISVISGMARGIDGMAQKAAIKAGGETYAVLGCGVLVCYPKENRTLYEELKIHGGILSEYNPYQQPQAGLFPARNRIISGLAEAVIVIEAKEKSGTCITVDMALEQGREVYAVPGRVHDELSKGCNTLIGQGAGVITAPEKLPELLFGICGRQTEVKKDRKNCLKAPELSQGEKILLDMLETTPTSLDTFYARIKEQSATGRTIVSKNGMLTLPELRKMLLDMTVKGYVNTTGGRYFWRSFFE